MRQSLLVILIALLAGAAWAQPGLVPATAPTSTQPTSQPTSRPTTAGKAAILDIDGEINDYTARTLEKRVLAAKGAGADTIILNISTPGGSVGAALQMSRFLRQESRKIQTIAYVHDYAYSAGTMIALACNEIWMAPGSVIGDVAPIIAGGGGLQEVKGAERAKMESPIVADFEQSAEQNGYDPLLVRSFVQYQVTVHYIQSESGEKRFVLPAEYDRLIKEGWKPVEGVKNPVDDESTLLTVSDLTAARIGISRGTVATVEALAAQKGAPIITHFETTAGESVVMFLNGSVLRGFLSLVFLLALYTSFSHPGTGMPEVAAVVCGAALFGVPLLTGYAGWLEIILIIIGVVLLAMELFVIPGFGVAGISGIILVLSGLVLTFVPSEAPGLPGGNPSFLPQMKQTRDALAEGFAVVSIGAFISMLLWLWLARYLPKIPYMNRLVLTTTVGETPEPGGDAGREAMESAWPAVGAVGAAATDLRPGGVGRFFDPIINDHRNIDVICDTGFLRVGTPIVIREHEGPRVVVRAHAAEAQGQT